MATQIGLPLRVPPALLKDNAEQVDAEDPHRDTGVQSIHVAPLCGWGSDPHGPIYYKGRYHLFYQARPGTCQWFWGMRWEHVVSLDLVTWVRLPPALLPTPGGLDADGCFTGNIQIHPATGVPMLFYTGARLRHNPTIKHLPDPPLEACNPLMFHWETQLLAVCDPDDELMVKWRKVETPWMELPHCAYLSSWRDPFFVPPELDPATGQPLHEIETSRPETAVTRTKQLAKLAPHAAAPAGAEEVGDADGAAAAADGAAATGSPASLSVENGSASHNGSPIGSCCGSSHDDAAGDGGFSGRSSISNNASSTNASAARSCPASTHRSPAAANGLPALANGHAANAASPTDDGSAGVLPDGMPVVRSSDDVACSEAATQPCADGQGREHMMLIGSGLEGLGGTALIYRSADLASGWRFDGYLCTWPNLDTGICWECPHLLNLSDLPPGVSCMPPTTTTSTTAANSSSTADSSAKAADSRVHVIASAAAAPAPAAPATAEDEQQLVELVNAAWASAGITPAQAVAWRDVSATAPAAPAAPEAAAAAAADAPPANPAAVDQPPLNSEPSATCTKEGTTLLPEPEEHMSLSIPPADAAAAAAAAATVAAVAADAAAAAAAAADAAAAPDTWTSALVQEVLEASLHQAETAAAAVQATLNSAVAAEVLDETSAMGSRSLPMTPAPSMAVSSVFGAAAAAAAAAAVAAVGNNPPGATPLASAGPSGAVPGPEMLNRSTSLRAVARALSRQASGASEDEVQTMLMQAMSDAMVARKHTAGQLAAAVAAAAENSETFPETSDEPSVSALATGAPPGTQSAPVSEDLPSSGQAAAGGSTSVLHHAATAPPAQTVDGLLQTIRADRQQQAAVAASGAVSDLNAVCNDVIEEESEEGSEGPEEESDGRELSFAPFAGMQRPIIPDPHAESEVPTLASEGPVSSAPVDLAPAQVPGATPSTRRAFSQPATLLPRTSGDYSLSPLAPTISIPPSTAASGELAPTPTARLAHANSLYDIKAVSEASVAGLGYASVLSSRAPHDAATAMMIADHLEAQGGAEAGQQRNMPTPPIFPSHGEGLTKEEIRAACRAYAEAAAAVQGHDLGCPANDAPVVQRCKKGSEGVPAPARPDQRWLLGLAPDAATYGILYFLGRYTHNRFHLDDAAGPFKLDMGNALYAPVAYYDRKHGRHLVWGYLKELRRLPPPPSMCNKFVASGCVSLPRALYLHEGRLHQVPLPELSRLRTGQVWQQQGVKLPAGLASGLTVPPEFAGDSLDLQLTVRRGTADSFAILLHTWRGDGEGEAALRFTWANRKLEVVYGGLTANGKAPAQTDCHHNHEPLPPQVGGLHTVEGAGGDSTYLVYVDPMVPPVPELNPDVPDWIRMKPAEAGGELWLGEDEPLQLRVFIDASAVEVFTGTGQVLCTRVYRGSQAEAAEKTSGMQLVAVGGEALIDNVEVHNTRPAWLRPEDAPLPPPVNPHNLALWQQQGLA